LKVRCKNCGWERELTPCEAKKIQEQEYFECGKCGSTFTKLEAEMECSMRYKWYSLEIETQCDLMNALFRRGVRVWDCPAEIGLCDDPIIIDNIAFGIQAGDFPFLLHDKYYIAEMKFQNYHIGFDKQQKLWTTSRSGRHFTVPQSKILLGGRGVMIWVSEPFFAEVGVKRFKAQTQEEAQRDITEGFWKKLANDTFSYRVWIIDSERFQFLWNEHLSKIEPRPSAPRRTRVVDQWSISATILEKYFPDERLDVTLSQYKQGVIADEIIELLESR
jgi:hypothetical protein